MAANALQPSGALLKAVLLGGAATVQGYEADTGLPVDPPPSFRQGFGRVWLGAPRAAGAGVGGRAWAGRRGRAVQRGAGLQSGLLGRRAGCVQLSRPSRTGVA